MARSVRLSQYDAGVDFTRPPAQQADTTPFISNAPIKDTRDFCKDANCLQKGSEDMSPARRHVTSMVRNAVLANIEELGLRMSCGEVK